MSEKKKYETQLDGMFTFSQLDGMFSFFHALDGFLQTTGQIHALPLANLKAELPLVKHLVLEVPFQCNWRGRQTTHWI